MTLSPKLNQPHALEVAEFEQALEDDSLEKTKKLWSKGWPECPRWKNEMDNCPLRVLLVEDNESDYVTTRRLINEIEGAKFVLEWVATYDTALKVIGLNQHDVYLIDYLLGERSGLELLREAVINGCKAPIILLTAQGNHEVDVEAMKTEAADYLNKSQISAPLLERSIRYAIECQQVESALALDISERQQAEEALRQQTQRERLLAQITQRIRQSLSLKEILSTTVSEVQQFLQSDRVFICRFEPDWGGVVVAESVGAGWKPILGSRLKDPTFAEVYVQAYKQGRTQATADIYAAGLTKCYTEFLAQFQVRATLVVPILQGELWGLLVVNQCASTRQWQQLELDLLNQLATQLAIAIQQATLFEQAQTELAKCKQAEQKIREQAALLDIATDAILVRDLGNQILFWSQGAERMYGWKAHEVLEKNVIELLYKQISPQLEEAQKSVIEKGLWQGELYKITKEGKEIIVESRWTLMLDEQSRPKSILAVDTDITQKKHLEVQFRRAQRLESIGTLAGGIAHDLNNVLGPILMIAELLQEKIPDFRSQQLLTEVKVSTKRGASLVKQVLSFARGMEGKRTVLQLRHLMLEIQQIAKQTFPKSIEVYTDIAPDLWAACGDATQLHQLLINLVVNARDAMPHGGSLRLCAENLLIDQNYAQMHLDAQVGPYIAITVADTGTGMPPETLERIFEPFFTTKELGKGTGLGLSTVMAIIKSHGGFVNVYSQVGKGSQFKVYFPAVEGSQKQQAEDLELPKGRGELILVVDDELAIREITKISLETYNYKVLTVSDGIEATALYAQQKNNISVVLMDMMMPSMDGATTSRILQKMNQQIKIIAVSGLVSSERVSGTMGTGVKAFLSKPYTTQELLKTLHSVLRAK